MTALSLDRPALGIAEHVRETVRLAVPVMLARCGLIIMITVDTLMTGRAGGAELAHYAIAYAPQITMLTVGIGLLVGTVVLTAQAVGAGRLELAGRIWRLALIVGGALGLLYALALLHGEAILLALGQTPELARAGGRVTAMWSFGMPGLLLYVATSSFLEGISRPKPGMVIALGACLLDAALNWILIYGHLGFPAMGAEGATLSTSITRWAMFAAILAYVLRMPDRDAYGVLAPLGGHFGQMKKLLVLGAPLALSIGFEASTFSAAATFAGWLGPTPLAAYQIAINFNSLVFMLAIGLSTATAVRVANAVGRGDALGLRRAGWVGTALTLPPMLLGTATLVVAPEWLARVYTDDMAVVLLTLPLFAITAWFCVADGLQAVLMGAVRGTADILLPTLVYGLSFWGIGVPLAYLFAFPFGGGVVGLFWGLFVSLGAALFLLAWRFHQLSRRAIVPI
jgi:MATE family multidrug resistance protein